MAFVLVPALFFVLLELSLRVAGYGYSTSYFKPSQIDGEDYLVPNSYFSYRFFPPALARKQLELRMPVDKPANTYRIFIFGESAAYGDPDPAYGMGRHLQVLLEKRFPGTAFEVVNTAMTAINSHAILPIAQEVAHLDGDLWIIYMGNNEMIGAFGPGTVFSSKAPSLAMVRTILAAKSTRTGQLMESLVSDLQKNDEKPEKWDGINMFSKNLDYADPGRLIAYDNFQANLLDILNEGKGESIPILLSTVASNLKHTAPFNSMHSENLTSDQISEWTSHYNEGIELETKGLCKEALNQYSQAASIDDGYADLQFRMGRCHQIMGELELALSAYSNARDYDGLAVRADTRINNIIRDAAEQHTEEEVSLVDSVRLLSRNTPDGIPGQTLFYEHVHYTIDGNFQLAQILADEVAKKLPDNITATDTGFWVDVKTSKDELAVTLWDQYMLWKTMSQRLAVPPHKGTLNYESNIAFSKAQTKQVISQIDLKKTPQRDRDLYLQAIEKKPDDNLLRTHFAQYLGGNDELPAAIRELKVVCELLPDLEWPHYFLGQYLANQKRYDEASRAFKRALAIRGDFTLPKESLEKIKKLKR